MILGIGVLFMVSLMPDVESGARMLIKSAKEIMKSYKPPEEPKIETKAEKPLPAEISISDLKLTDVTGIGSKLANRLKSSGYDSVERLARSRPSTVSRMITGLNIDRAESIVTAAQNLVRTAQLRRFEVQMAPKTLAKETKPKKPSKKRVKKVTKKAPEPEKAKPEKPTRKKTVRETPKPPTKERVKPKKKT